MKKRSITVLLLTALMLSMMVGCTTQKTQGDNNSEVTLKWLIGGPGVMKDSELVWKKFNEKLENYLPNTKVDFEVVAFADYAEKWKLIAASREEVDIVWSGWMLDLNEEVKKGSYLPLDDLIQKNAPELNQEFPKWFFDIAKVDSKVYCLPNYQMMTNLPWGMRTHKELADKYLDSETLYNNFHNNDNLTREDLKPIEDYLEKLKQNGELRKGVSPTFLDWILKKVGQPKATIENVKCNAVIHYEDNPLKVYDEASDTQATNAYYDIVNDWFAKGYIRQDITALQDPRQDDGKENGYVIWAHQAFKGEEERESKKCGFPVKVIPLIDELTIGHGKSSTNTAISATSKNPDRAMKLIALMNTEKGKELYNLLSYGMEDIHYNKISENRIEWLEKQMPGNSSDNKYGYAKWVIGNTKYAFETQYDPEGWNEYIDKEVNQKAKISPLMGFTLDISPIKLEIAQYNAVIKEYAYLDMGGTPNYTELLEKKKQKLKEAGSEKIAAEVQRQIDNWQKNK